MAGRGRMMAGLARLAAILIMAPVLDAQATCTCNYGGAVAGSIFGTLLVIVILLVIIWFCCLRGTWLKRHGRGIDQTFRVSTPNDSFVNVDVEGLDRVDVGVIADFGEKPHQKEQLQQVWGIPHVMRPFVDQCEIPHDAVVGLKLDHSQKDLQFSIAQHEIALFVKDTQSNSKLTHIRNMEEGMHIIGLSVAFNAWNAKEAARFIAEAAPYKPHLYVRGDPLFDVEGLRGIPVTMPTETKNVDCGVQSSSDSVDLKEYSDSSSDNDSELVVVETARSVQAAPTLKIQSEAESIVITDDDPAVIPPSHPSWTFERKGDENVERILSIDRPPPPPPRSVSDKTSHSSSSSWEEQMPPGSGSNFDIYRATPISLLDEGQFDLNVDDPGDFADPLENESKDSGTVPQPSLMLDVKGDLPRDASSLDSLAVDSGLGSSANIAFNGLHSPSDASQDGRTELVKHFELNGFSPSAELSIPSLRAYKDSPISPNVIADAIEIPDISSSTISRSSSSCSSIAEAPIEPTENARKTFVAPKTGLEHLHELSELDRKIALNNIEIATLMLNDSQDRQFFMRRPVRSSESESEEVIEEPISATSREEVRKAPNSRLNSFDELVLRNSTILSDSRRRNSNDRSLDTSELEDVDDEELSNVINRLAESSDSEHSIQLRSTTDLHYEPDEAYA